jgi:hypothetical protein
MGRPYPPSNDAIVRMAGYPAFAAPDTLRVTIPYITGSVGIPDFPSVQHDYEFGSWQPTYSPGGGFRWFWDWDGILYAVDGVDAYWVVSSYVEFQRLSTYDAESTSWYAYARIDGLIIEPGSPPLPLALSWRGVYPYFNTTKLPLVIECLQQQPDLTIAGKPF